MKKWLATFVALFALVVFVNDAGAWGWRGYSSGYYYAPGPVTSYYPGYYYPSTSYYVSPSYYPSTSYYYPGTVYNAPTVTYYSRPYYYAPGRYMSYPTMTWRYGW